MVTVTVAAHPVDRVYEITDVPGEIAVNNPVEETMEATNGLLLLHVPPVVLLARVVVSPTQSAVVPEIGAGSGLTVNGVVIKQPVDAVYVIVATPADSPVTTPVDESIEATAGLLLLHVPPAPSNKGVVEPSQTFVVPDIAPGVEFTVTLNVAEHPVPIV